MCLFHILVGLYLVEYSVTTYGCTFPASFTGTWKASEHGTITMNRTHIFDFLTVSSTSGLPLDILSGRHTFDYVCVENNGSLYSFRSTNTIPVLGMPFYILMCLDIQLETNTKMVYYKSTNPDPGGRHFQMATQTQLGGKTISVICDYTDYKQPYNYNIVIKSGRESTASILCPADLFGTYTYNTCTDPASSNTSMNVCDSRQQLVFNYTLCSTPQMFSGEGTLDCVYYLTSGSITYLTLFNRDSTEPDGSRYYQYVCLAVEKVGDTVFVTARPRLFLENQKPTSIDSSGIPYNSTLFVSPCAITTTGTTSTTRDPTNPTTAPPSKTRADLALILGVVFGALVATMVTVVFTVVCIKKNRFKNTTVAQTTHTAGMVPSKYPMSTFW